MSLHDGVVHYVVGDLVCARLDHNDLAHGRGDSQVKIALGALCLGGVDDQLAVNKTHEHSADRSVPRNIGNGQCDGRTEHGGDLR